MPISNALFLAQEISQLIHYSPKRSSLFEDMQADLSPGAPKVKPLCPTLWTVHTHSIDAVLKNYMMEEEMNMR